MPVDSQLAIRTLDDFIYGVCPYPVRLKNGLVVGGGTVYPELNFTLPDMNINQETFSEVRQQYTQMVQEVCRRAVELGSPGLVVEFELLPELTLNPEWGAEITCLLRQCLDRVQGEAGILTALRVTPNDIREFERPPLQRRGPYLEKMFRSFELCGAAGADMLSVESTGGKELHDDAILGGDLQTAAFALGVLGSRDMIFLWERIVEIGAKHDSVPAGDSACGFGNTAMVLAGQQYIPKVGAALLRVMTVPRSLVAFECGARGPSKDCAYEGPYLKAITGCPIALEGAEAACAHPSPIGNIAKAVPDLWSNESVNNVKLLGGMAPTVSLEQLVYATRLMNTAASHGPESARQLRDWVTESDAALDPQAWVLRPDVVLKLAAEIMTETTPYRRTRRAALATLDLLRQANRRGDLKLSPMELPWLDRLSRQADQLPEEEEELLANLLPEIDPKKISLEEYGLL
jgi:methanol---5-hydroxybenzimidazolylcobamide Co-methyltransferase